VVIAYPNRGDFGRVNSVALKGRSTLRKRVKEGGVAQSKKGWGPGPRRVHSSHRFANSQRGNIPAARAQRKPKKRPEEEKNRREARAERAYWLRARLSLGDPSALRRATHEEKEKLKKSRDHVGGDVIVLGSWGKTNTPSFIREKTPPCAGEGRGRTPKEENPV